jgi:hypothetical protein
VTPRLLDVDGAARYSSLSAWTIRDLIASGALPRVVVPSGPGKELRAIRIDRFDLDRLIERWKESTVTTASATPMARPSRRQLEDPPRPGGPLRSSRG